MLSIEAIAIVATIAAAVRLFAGCIKAIDVGISVTEPFNVTATVAADFEGRLRWLPSVLL